VIVAHAGHVSSAKATDVTSAKSAHMASAKATHVASATHATTMSPTSAAATAGLCTSGKKAAGKHRTCQNHHHSSSHDILHLDGRICRHRTFLDVVFSEGKSNVAMNGRWECLLVVSTKFSFNQPIECRLA
jgi:hypothetical protein